MGVKNQLNVIRLLIVILLVLTLSSTVFAVNDPGHDSLYLQLIGGTLSGVLTINNYLNVTGNVYVGGNISMSGTKITNLANGTDGQDAVTLSQLQSINSSIETDTNTWWGLNEGYIYNNSNSLDFNETLLNTTIDSRVDGAVTDIWVNTAGDTMTGNLNMNANNITNLNQITFNVDQIEIGSSKTIASGTDTIAIGEEASSTGDYSISLGSSSALGLDSLAMLFGAVAIGNGTISIGSWSTASGLYSISLGGAQNIDGAVASGDYSIAIGGGLDYGAVASGNYSIAIGEGTDVSATDAIALGRGTTNAVANSFKVGSQYVTHTFLDTTLNISGNTNISGTLSMETNKITNLANGTSGQDAVTKSQLDAINSSFSGDLSGYVPYTDATSNVDLGSYNLTTTGTISIGSNNVQQQVVGSCTYGIASVAENGTITCATQQGTGDVVGPSSARDNAIARFDGITGKLIQSSALRISDSTGAISFTEGDIILGSDSTVFNHPEADSIVIGNLAYAGADAISLGTSTYTAHKSIAIGYDSNSSGTSSIAIGEYSIASGNQAIAIGGTSTSSINTEATGVQSIAIGYNLTTSADNSILIGTSATTESTGSIVIGTSASVNNKAANSIALGTNTSVIASNAIAIGTGTTNAVENSFKVGGDITHTFLDTTLEVGGAIDMNSNKITELANGTSSQDAVTYSQLQAINTSILGGDVVGPSLATDNAIATFDGATGKIIQNSSFEISSNTIWSEDTNNVLAMWRGEGWNAYSNAGVEIMSYDSNPLLNFYSTSGDFYIGIDYDVDGGENFEISHDLFSSNDFVIDKDTGDISIGQTLNMTSGKITNLANGTDGQDAVTKSQLDAVQGSISDTWWGLNEGYIYNNSNSLDFNETLLNTTIDSRVDGAVTDIWVDVAGDTMSGDLDMNSNDVTQISELYFINSILLDSTTVARTYSIGIGHDLTLSGDGVIAIGDEASATGGYSLAIGEQTQANGINSIAIGKIANSTNLDSIAIGASNFATGDNAIVLGSYSYADSANSIAIGYQSEAWGEGSVAIGSNNLDEAWGAYAEGINSLAIMDGSDAYGDYSIAIGDTTYADATNAIALGRGTTNAVANSFKVGSEYVTHTFLDTTLNISGNTNISGNLSMETNKITNLANGTDGQDAVTKSQLDAVSGSIETDTDTWWNITGSNYLINSSNILELNETILNTTIDARVDGAVTDIWVDVAGDTMSGDLNMSDKSITNVNQLRFNLNEIQIGTNSVANSLDETGSIAIGKNSNAHESSISIGDNSKTQDDQSIAIGLNSNAVETYTIAIGSGANSVLDQSMAIGYDSNASGLGSTAIGTNSVSSGTVSSAIGSAAVSSGMASSSLGSAASTSGDFSVAIGPLSNATAENAIALGYGTENSVANSFKVGSQYVTHTFLDTTLNISGNTNISGNLSMETNKITNLANGTSSQDAVTKSQLDAVSGSIETDTDTWWNITGSNYLINSTNILELNETILNTTIDSRVSTNVPDIWVNESGDTMTGSLTMSGTAANIILGSNYLSGDGGDEGIFVDSAGKVGIGTTTPAHELHISGVSNVEVYSQASSATSYGGFRAGGDTADWGLYAGGSTNILIPDGFGIYNHNASQYDLVIDASSNVGIGTTTPTTKLDIIDVSQGIKTKYGTLKVEATDAHLDIVSSSAGVWGSGLNFVEGNVAGVSNTNIWSIAR
ncbi:MAG: hypothetical protein PHU51_01335 [Candidatus Nanoarchaeia archaeon]|nr:hypothetical protein [Candidatus Nanoarchaeia archaeon]